MPITALMMRRRGGAAARLGSVYDLTPKALPGAFRMGVNLSGPESGNPYPDEPMIRDLAAHGHDWFRQPFSWDAMQPTLDGPISSSEFNKLSAVMALALKYGLKVLPDSHAYGTHLGKKVGAAGGDTPTTFGRYWGQLSTKFMADVSFAAVAGYDFNNEWQGMDPALQPGGWDSSDAASQAIVEASVNAARDQVRANGDSTTLYIELDHYTGAWEWTLNTPSQQNLAIFLRLLARDTNIVASVHMYPDNDNSGRNFDWYAETQKPGVAPINLATNVYVGIQRLSGVVAAAYQHGFRLHLGECGWGGNSTAFGDVTGWSQFGQATLAYLKCSSLYLT